MIVHNITNNIAPAIETEWVQWQQQEHIPETMASGYFTEYKFYRLLEQDKADGIVYIIQYFIPSLENYSQYIMKLLRYSGKKHLINGVINSLHSAL
jgi:uncharacterized protein DUF4286